MRLRPEALAVVALLALPGCPRTDGGATASPAPAITGTSSPSSRPPEPPTSGPEPVASSTPEPVVSSTVAPTASSAEPASSLVPVSSGEGSNALEILRKHCHKAAQAGALEDWQKEQCRALLGEGTPR